MTRLGALRKYAVLATALGAASCASNPSGMDRTPVSAAQRALPAIGNGSPLQHIVVIVQENRSFDDFFANFPGADGTTTGQMKLPSGDKAITLKQVDLAAPCDFRHSYRSYETDYDSGQMDGFNLEGGQGKCTDKATGPYQFVNPLEIAPYWDLATQYVLADQMFQTQGSGSFTAHQDLIAGATVFNRLKTKSLVNTPTANPWGCDGPPGTTTSYLESVSSKLVYHHATGPFPCMKYETMRDVLDARQISWKYYSPPVKGGSSGALWNAFDAIKAVRNSPEWGTNVTTTDTQIFTDISTGMLPAVSWVIPDSVNSDHPETSSDTGPSWVATVVNAIGESGYWRRTAIVIVWDDWGGFYDHVKPPFQDQWGGLGFRVPMIVVSSYARQSYVSHTQYEFGSILKFMEQTFALSSLGTTDVRATSIVDCLDFTQQPRPFVPVPAKYDRAYFEHQRPSYKPVDTE